MDTVPAPPQVAHDPPADTAASRDGWTIQSQLAFIANLAETASVAHAARAAGHHRSSAYRLRADPRARAFRAAWDAALHMAYARLREVAFDRAVNGVQQPVYHGGEEIGRRTIHNDRLLMFLLDHEAQRRPHAPHLADLGDHSPCTIDDVFAAACDRLSLPPPPPAPPRPPRPPRPRREPAPPAAAQAPPAPAPVPADSDAPRHPFVDRDRDRTDAGLWRQPRAQLL